MGWDNTCAWFARLLAEQVIRKASPFALPVGVSLASRSTVQEVALSHDVFRASYAACSIPCSVALSPSAASQNVAWGFLRPLEEGLEVKTIFMIILGC